MWSHSSSGVILSCAHLSGKMKLHGCQKRLRPGSAPVPCLACLGGAGNCEQRWSDHFGFIRASGGSHRREAQSGSPDPRPKVKVAQSCPTRCDPMDYTVHRILQARTGVGSLSLLRRIFPTQRSNPDLQRCGQILFQLSHQGIPRILERVTYPFSRGSS